MRPDYCYVVRFIRDSEMDRQPAVSCLTATAKPEVVADMVGYFRGKVGIELEVLDGGHARQPGLSGYADDACRKIRPYAPAVVE
jgi:ATP-dependent DNA helicase RecQ